MATRDPAKETDHARGGKSYTISQSHNNNRTRARPQGRAQGAREAWAWILGTSQIGKTAPDADKAPSFIPVTADTTDTHVGFGQT